MLYRHVRREDKREHSPAALDSNTIPRAIRI
jgi:hypothetical protein